MEMSKAEHAKMLRYKRSALESIGYEEVINKLNEMQEACGEVRYYIDQDGRHAFERDSGMTTTGGLR